MPKTSCRVTERWAGLGPPRSPFLWERTTSLGLQEAGRSLASVGFL